MIHEASLHFRRRAALCLALALLAGAGSVLAADLCATGGLGKGRGWVAGVDGDSTSPDPDPVGGMGGTGIVADARRSIGTVIGTVTRFGSICVNGIEIEFNDGVPITVRGERATAAAIGLGQVVRVATDLKTGHPVARSIATEDAVSGPVTTRDTASQTFAVMGRTVRMGRDSMVALSGPVVPDIGTHVTVSGIAQPDGTVVASRLEYRDPRTDVHVTGLGSRFRWRVHRRGRRDGASSDGDDGRRYAAGAEVSVSGRWQDDELRAITVTRDPLTPGPGPESGWVSLEGFYVRCEGDSSSHAVSGIPVTAAASMTPGQWVGRRVVVLGTWRQDATLEIVGIGTSSLDESGEGAPAPALQTGLCRPPSSQRAGDQ
ncbi:MAG: hypothetical protein IPK20_25800 [Betaproteobacteria bacterium]|nr:hypothetical protein [Betaproteobacteria bacterium]